MNIPYGYHSIDNDDIKAVTKALKSQFITQGPLVREFEEKIKQYTGAKYAVAVSNGTAGLYAACFAAGIERGDEVITTPITFAASSNSVIYCGATPVFADVRKDNCNIDPKNIRVTKKTKAVMAVDFAGHPADLDELRKICTANNLVLIEDAAHSLGAEYKGRKIGSQADLTVLSFHPVKVITTGEGGMILTNNEKFYQRLVLFRNHGITRDNSLLFKKDGGWYYEMLELGYNFRITDIQSALGISQMDKIDRFIERRREIVSMYNKAFKEIDEVFPLEELPNAKSAWHIYVLRFRLERFQVPKTVIFDELTRRGILVNLHYIPVYFHPYYQKMGYKKGICSEAETYYEQAMTIPLFPKMRNKDVKFVINSIKELIKKYGK